MPGKGCQVGGLISRRSDLDVPRTVVALSAQTVARGARVFTVVDHAEAAHEVGLSLPATRVVIFGKPEVGTELLRHYPDIAIDLPSRLLDQRHRLPDPTSSMSSRLIPPSMSMRTLRTCSECP
jgi:uncharacterized protein (DUF302 family)